MLLDYGESARIGTALKFPESLSRWRDVERIRVSANGISFEVFTAGAGDRLALCLHGFPEHAYSWRYQIPLLARLGYRVWAPNLRGYGATDSPLEISAYAIENLVEDVASLIRAAEARETLLLAHDWGGALAWALAMQQPELVDRLAVCNLPHPACFRREFRRLPQFLKSWYMLWFQVPWLPEAALRRKGAAAIGRIIRRTSCDPARFPDDVLDVYRWNALRPGGLTAMLNWYRALLRGGGWRRSAKQPMRRIDAPTLLVWGEEDAALDIRTTRATEEYVSDFTFRPLLGVSHWVQQEAPEQVNAILEAWLAGAPAGGSAAN